MGLQKREPVMSGEGKYFFIVYAWKPDRDSKWEFENKIIKDHLPEEWLLEQLGTDQLGVFNNPNSVGYSYCLLNCWEMSPEVGKRLKG